VFKRATAWLFYRLMRAVTENEIEANVGEFRLDEPARGRRAAGAARAAPL
jgi:hypothetical protein